MEINNHLRTIKFKIRKFIFLLFFIILIIILHFTNIWVEPKFGITRTHLTFLFIAFIILYYFIEYILDFQYIYFSDQGEKITLRYYSLRPMQNIKNSIEIPKNIFTHYELLPSLLNLKPKIVLYAKNRSGVAKYPPVCLSALTSSERRQILKSLDKLATNQ